MDSQWSLTSFVTWSGIIPFSQSCGSEQLSFIVWFRSVWHLLKTFFCVQMSWCQRPVNSVNSSNYLCFSQLCFDASNSAVIVMLLYWYHISIACLFLFQIFDIAWDPFLPHRLVSCGVKHIKVSKLEIGSGPVLAWFWPGSGPGWSCSRVTAEKLPTDSLPERMVVIVMMRMTRMKMIITM